jgi:MurNAc alpha-1-phosphate uridylyltransferase
MQALILAAGRGTRMLPLTKTCPKPLLPLGKSTLIECQIQQLVAAGIQSIVITLHHLGQQIFDRLGDGSRWSIKITYSWEEQLLDTGGGIAHALPLLSPEPFLVVNSDIVTNYPYQQLLSHNLNSGGHIVLVNNPANTQGDFNLADTGAILPKNAKHASYTFSGISVLHPLLFTDFLAAHKCGSNFTLLSVFKYAMAQGSLSGSHYLGEWVDAGTADNYQQLQKIYA